MLKLHPGRNVSRSQPSLAVTAVSPSIVTATFPRTNTFSSSSTAVEALSVNQAPVAVSSRQYAMKKDKD